MKPLKVSAKSAIFVGLTLILLAAGVDTVREYAKLPNHTRVEKIRTLLTGNTVKASTSSGLAGTL